MADHSFQVENELVVVPVRLFGKHSVIHNCAFILDTGSSGIIIDHTVAFDLGYSARDGIGFSTVKSAIGREKGYRLVVEGFEALGQRVKSVEVRCHDLKEQGVEGLIGMTFLKRFN